MRYKQGDLIVWDKKLPFEILRVHSQRDKLLVADFKCIVTGSIFRYSTHNMKIMGDRVKKISKLECVIRFGI